VRSLFSAVQVVTVTGDKHLLKYQADAPAVIATIDAARGAIQHMTNALLHNARLIDPEAGPKPSAGSGSRAARSPKPAKGRVGAGSIAAGCASHPGSWMSA
jgi:hypothetical protein